MKNRSTFFGFVILFILVLGTIYTLFIRPSYYRFNGGEAVLTPVSNSRLNEEFIDMKVINGYIFECNKNGLLKKSIDGETIWSKGFFMEAPYMVNSEEHIAVADITGKSVYVFGKEGFVREIKESYPIIDVHINQEGFVTIVQEKDKQNIINYYNDEGSLVVTRSTRFFEDGYPLDVVTSPKVTKMMTGYLNVSNNRLQTKISFFGFEDKYDNFEENIIGGFTYDNSLLSDLYWISENKTLAVMDNQMIIYDCENEPSVVKAIEVQSELVDVVVTEEEIVVWYGKAMEASETDHSDTIVVYDFDGEEVASISYDERIQGISGSDEGFYVLTSAQVIKYVGRSREWFASTYLTVVQFMEIDENRFLAQTNQGYEILKIRDQ